MKYRIPFGFLFVSLLFLSACQRIATAQPTAVVQTPIPPTASSTATSVATREPTLTPTPIPPTPITPSLEPTLEATFTATVEPITELLFTGAIVPGRCVQAAIDERGNADFLYESVRSITQKANITIGTLNAALSDYPPHTGCIQTFVLVGGSENADAMAAAGFDVMSVATNHIKNCGLFDCGERAFFDTLANLERVGIQAVGAGQYLDQALEPVVVVENGIRFGFVSLGEIEPSAFASKTTPGIAELTDQNLQQAIADAKEIADVVIALPHWGSDYSFTPNYRQLHFAEVAVDAGADLVIGNHAHVIQGMKEINGIPVFYGLGSFIFDQDWSLETQQGIIVRILFKGQDFHRYDVIPVHIDGDGHVQLPDTKEAADILSRFKNISQDIP
jgi:poly-gamma-glutamate capsule biosynthesis protein CapA/YwtB (metallophosphatase superfamily)